MNHWPLVYSFKKVLLNKGVSGLLKTKGEEEGCEVVKTFGTLEAKLANLSPIPPPNCRLVKVGLVCRNIANPWKD